jgi:acetyl esterase/lipase
MAKKKRDGSAAAIKDKKIKKEQKHPGRLPKNTPGVKAQTTKQPPAQRGSDLKSWWRIEPLSHKWPLASPANFSVERQDRLLERFVRGKWRGRKTQMEERVVYRRDGSILRVLVVWSNKGTDAKATGLLWLHGGAYMAGIPEQAHVYADLFCSDGNCVMVIPDYRKAGEKPYPAALWDAYDALVWMQENANVLHIDVNQLFVGGECAGGGLAVALALYARDQREVAIAYLMPLFPMMDDQTFRRKAKIQKLTEPDLNRAQGWEMYLSAYETRGQVPMYAAAARVDELSGLPPVCTYVGREDPFYEETIAFVKKLKEAGIRVAFHIFPGRFRVFDWLVPANHALKQARAFLKGQFKTAQKSCYQSQFKGRSRKAKAMMRRRAMAKRRRNLHQGMHMGQAGPPTTADRQPQTVAIKAMDHTEI